MAESLHGKYFIDSYLKSNGSIVVFRALSYKESTDTYTLQILLDNEGLFDTDYDGDTSSLSYPYDVIINDIEITETQAKLMKVVYG